MNWASKVKILTSTFDSSCLYTVEGKKKRSPSDRALSNEPGMCVIISPGNMLGSCMVNSDEPDQRYDNYDNRDLLM